MRILVTRPEPQASAWAGDLRGLGLPADALPLIAIDGPLDEAPIRDLWQRLSTVRALMFVSPAAVAWFFRLRPERAIWPAGTLAAAPGPGTAQALIATGAESGLTPGQVLSPNTQSAQFDSEALWPLLSPLPWHGSQVRIIGGGDGHDARGRTWLSEQWRAQGAQVDTMLAYRRGPGQWGPAHRQLATRALTDPVGHLWLFSSSQAIDHLVEAHLPALDPPPGPDWTATARAIATHPRIAERARQLGFGQVIEARPTLDAVAQARRSLP